MATPAQIAANRANAAKSTGPRTPEGKARSSQNNLRHGFRGGAAIINEQDPAFARILAGHIARYHPSGPAQLAAVHRIARHDYRRRLLDQMQDDLLLSGRLLSCPTALATLFAYAIKEDKKIAAAIREFREMQSISDVRTQSSTPEIEDSNVRTQFQLPEINTQTYEPNWLCSALSAPVHFQPLPSSATTLNWMYTWT